MKAWLFCCVSGLNAAKFVCKADPAEMYRLSSIGKAAQARVCLYSVYSFKTQPLHPVELRDTQQCTEHNKCCPCEILCSVQLEDFPNLAPADWAEAILLQHSLAAALAHGNMAAWYAHNILLMRPADYTLILLAVLACCPTCCSSLRLGLHTSAHCVFSTSQCRLKVVQSSSSSPSSI